MADALSDAGAAPSVGEGGRPGSLFAPDSKRPRTDGGGGERGGSGGGRAATLALPATRHSRPTERIAAGARSKMAARAGAARRPQAGARPPAQAGASARRRDGGRVPPTRVAPRPTPRRNLNPAARRRTAAAFGLVLTLLAGMILTVVLTSRHSNVRVPRLTGLSRAAVSTKTARLGLHPKFGSRFDKAPRGTVIAQTPQPGATVNSGSTVRVTLSAGPPPVPVPNVVGESAANAQNVLQSMGLRSTTSYVPAPGDTPGTVHRQNPPAKATISPGSTVALSVAETPRWKALTSFSGENSGRSVPFRIRGTRWRVVYSMSYAGTCALIFICQGPHMHIAALRGGATAPGFDLNEGDNQVQTYESGAGVYQISISPGSDIARWSVKVEDYY
jgi:PASTA domain